MVVLVGGFELAYVGKLRDEPDLLPLQLSHGVGDGKAWLAARQMPVLVTSPVAANHRDPPWRTRIPILRDSLLDRASTSRFLVEMFSSTRRSAQYSRGPRGPARPCRGYTAGRGE